MASTIVRWVAALAVSQALLEVTPGSSSALAGEPRTAAAIADIVSRGADPTGVRDSTAAIQAALDAIPPSGGKVRFPCGTYRVTSSITRARGGLVIEGDGGGGWASGSCVRIQASARIVVFDLGDGSDTDVHGTQISGISVNDATPGGVALGAFRVRRQNYGLFRNVAVNGFGSGYAFMLDGTGDAVIMTRFEGVTGRGNRLGITTRGRVVSTYVSPNTFFASATGGPRGAIGVQLDDSSQMYGAVDDYETCVRLVGDGSLVQARLEGCTLGVHVAGPVARRNVILGTRFIGGGTNASVRIDPGERIHATVVMGNTYAAPAVGIVDDSLPGSDSYILEPQANTFITRRAQPGTARWEVRNTHQALGDAAELRASADDAGVQAVLRAAIEERGLVKVGAATDQDVEIIANGRPQLRVSREAGIARGGTALLLRVSRSGTTSLEPVTLGAPDSAGAGYRVLRVRN
ncbi:MAG TPA: glycosyl hydrolase family 28-related protein [Anaeromyxobacteraceae bacterium]